MDLLIVLLSFLLGGVPFGLLLGRLKGIDVRVSGSGHIGATNVMRNTGVGLGLVTFFLDAAKGAAGPLMVRYLDLPPSMMAWTGLAAVLGHCFSPFLRLRGGKGVATLVGAFSIMDLPAALLAAMVFATALVLSRYVALASLFLALALAGATWSQFGFSDPRTVVAWAAACLVAGRHRQNWRRMAEGREGKLVSGGPEGPFRG
ncbi:MAG: glycerol-3-phosphate 1-O-acyltransferase PlsY [Acidobacteriota bacterium]